MLIKFPRPKKFHLVSPLEQFKTDLLKKKANLTFNSNFSFNNLVEDFTVSRNSNFDVFTKQNKTITDFDSKFTNAQNVNYFFNTSTNDQFTIFSDKLVRPKSYITHGDLVDNNREVKRAFGVNKPMRIIKYDEGMDLFKLRFETNFDTIKQKNKLHSTYLTFKQKRYKKRKFILPIINNVSKAEMYLFLDDAGFIANLKNKDANTITYNLIKKNKVRTQQPNILLSKRLLRVKKTLVLPAHVNITAITNSYDVIHSWFIPGLGLKMDCIPGRATHHTFFIDNVGFYYGQCAEVCGRYHHHMPIRVCALPFDHFLVWWYNFGIPKLLFSTKNRSAEKTFYLRKYV